MTVQRLSDMTMGSFQNGMKRLNCHHQTEKEKSHVSQMS